jgi:acyl-CoA reductase-like NAD-dependent aldehyde dehydrogenase
MSINFMLLPFSKAGQILDTFNRSIPMPNPLPKNTAGVLRCISPVDGRVYAERPLHDKRQIDAALTRAQQAQRGWRDVPLAQRQAVVLKALDHFLAHADEIGMELTWQMGRPARYAAFEIKNGFQERIRYMTALAPRALADFVPEHKPGFMRRLERVPVGVVAIIAPWNYPYLTSSNGIIPALLAGNAVVVKHSHQTPLCADRYAAAFAAAGLPDGVLQSLDLTHEDTEKLIADPRVGFVNFTGSVAGGHAVQKATGNKFMQAGLELGGNDPAYVRADAKLDFAIENLVDGAFFNSGQSCCGIERIYVHENLYDKFIEGFVDLTKKYVLGNPLEPMTTLGPMVRTAAADAVRARIADCVQRGAKARVDEKLFGLSQAGTPYLAPQVLVDVDHSMPVMNDETFGPAVGMMKVKDDAEALRLMNDSRYGLTASVWTEDVAAAETLGRDLECGTVFVNRCDYVDPALGWSGVKDTGCGATLSWGGFAAVTRPKGFHFKTGEKS